MIEHLDNLSVKSKYEEIISYLNSLAIPYNISLETRFKNFKNELEKNKASLESSIKKYIQNINKCLKDHSSCVEKFIQTICENIKNFNTNYSEIHKSRDYIIPTKLLNFSGGYPQKLGLKPDEISKIYKISDYVLAYRNASRIFNSVKGRLSSKQLEHYSKQFVTKTVSYDGSKPTKNNIDEVLNPLQGFKAHVDRFITNIQYVKKLEEIGGYIKTMKEELKPIKNKVKEEVKSYIEQLSEIKVDAAQVEKDIRKINSMNNIIIGKLQIAKHTIEFYKSLEDEISKLKGVTFKKYDIEELIQNSSEIKEKLTKFQQQINSHLKTLKDSYNKIPGHTVFIDSPTYTESYYKNLISPVETFVDNSLKRIKIMQHIHQVLQQILELECAIEGVPRNVIQCSLLSLIPIIINNNNENIKIKR